MIKRIKMYYSSIGPIYRCTSKQFNKLTNTNESNQRRRSTKKSFELNCRRSFVQNASFRSKWANKIFSGAYGAKKKRERGK